LPYALASAPGGFFECDGLDPIWGGYLDSPRGLSASRFLMFGSDGNGMDLVSSVQGCEWLGSGSRHVGLALLTLGGGRNFIPPPQTSVSQE